MTTTERWSRIMQDDPAVLAMLDEYPGCLWMHLDLFCRKRFTKAADAAWAKAREEATK